MPSRTNPSSLDLIGRHVIQVVLCLSASSAYLTADEFPVQVEGDRLIYVADTLGNRIPDFSHCGYAGGNHAIPETPVRIVLQPGSGDDTARIQAAIDAVSALAPDDTGLRGAVLLAAGEFRIAGHLSLHTSGVVLRGDGALSEGTTLIGTGTDRRTMIQIRGGAYPEQTSPVVSVMDDYVPVGSRQLQLESTDGLSVGSPIRIVRPCTQAWIASLGMDSIPNRWKPGTHPLVWQRELASIDGNTITLDAPITTAIEQRFGSATVQVVDWPTRVHHVGIEDLQLESEVDAARALDEDHTWFGTSLENCRDCWVQRVSFQQFAGGAVVGRESTSRVTVADCISRDPVSEPGGFRRHTFFTRGQQWLFLRCWSEHGRRDFCTGHCAAGPNAFVHCFASQALGHSGPIESWSSGVLFDNVRIDGRGLHLRRDPANGIGWTAANSVIWQSRASTMHCEQPPGGNNWALGVWSDVAGDGTIEATSEFVKPLSLYQAQVRERLGVARAEEVGPFLLKVVAATRPTMEEAREFVANSSGPAPRLLDVIRERMADRPKPETSGTSRLALPTESAPSVVQPTVPATPLTVTNGWLTIAGRVVTGGTYFPRWWRGSLRPSAAEELGPAITRFAPGLDGRGLTDRLSETADEMQRQGQVAYHHHYGLWYDRRRDDHLMLRRADASVRAPFYEQPFLRSGRGTAWDGLSKYDLTQYNPWYWGRLRDFATLCDQRGLVLLHEHFFQHNILEAGAHWADSPWRTVNNINATDFPEPPPYVSDKRIFQAHLFYDTAHDHRQSLQRAYIRQCLENSRGRSNVIHLTSGEYTGPLNFIELWLDTIAEWKQETGQNPLIALSCTKDVQDAILADPRRAEGVDIIDIRYWTYTSDGKLYAPKGGLNLSPRQHQRLQKPKTNSFASIVRSVRDYRERFPKKVVTYFAEQHCGGSSGGWAALMGGGSLANVPRLPDELAGTIPSMTPDDAWVQAAEGPTPFPAYALANDREALIFLPKGTQTLRLRRPRTERLRLTWLDAETAKIIGQEETLVATGIAPKSDVLWVQVLSAPTE